MHIQSLEPGKIDILQQLASLMVAAFARTAPDYLPDQAAALRELQDLFARGFHLRAALAEEGKVVGLIGGRSAYGGNVWELHALAVHPDYQGQGIGRILVADIEEIARAAGAHTLWLGTDDEVGLTSLAGIDLYPDPLKPLRTLQNRDRHPYEFYQKCGFVITGVLPDANGPGKPDIFMAKRIRTSEAY